MNNFRQSARHEPGDVLYEDPPQAQHRRLVMSLYLLSYLAFVACFPKHVGFF